jgi:2-oxoglutarate ferredoxin oxidoreductase subunit alpha
MSKKLDNMKLLRGNEAVVEGALKAGCKFFFGYPITPQNELFEYMAGRMPQENGIFLQCESELAGINMIFGASAAGARCMTSSSGPGFTLMGEGFTAMAAAQLPSVVVSVTRAGPGLGRIASAQSDYRLATQGGGHGDYQAFVFGPASAQELFELTYDAFDIADKYRNPVVILSDAILGQMMEPVDLLTKKKMRAPKKEWALTNNKRVNEPRKVIKVAPHTDEELIQLNKDLKVKYRLAYRKEQRFEAFEKKNSKIGIIAFGSTFRIVKDAVDELGLEGIETDIFRPLSLWPFPEIGLKDFAAKKDTIIVIEANNGQMVNDVKLLLRDSINIYHYGFGGGHIFTPAEIAKEVKDFVNK